MPVSEAVTGIEAAIPKKGIWRNTVEVLLEAVVHPVHVPLVSEAEEGSERL